MKTEIEIAEDMKEGERLIKAYLFFFFSIKSFFYFDFEVGLNLWLETAFN
ncbi:hypothetical protein QOZ98_002293 [Planomicrobium stackebrandtii]|uniref:Uncharacterized protein n=1 Tax=Planomicrobium stackebrandtii TaxID=253160 RepID=A0ABU0GVS4_9BACL|nr:hypothetical protein [Planococcus soli]MDQ0429465.1 hypothetical protein [Planomicrobium stackebrandtii]